MKKYWVYFKYILEHKKNVFKTCWKKGLYLHAFTHDLSKFSIIEFFGYANYDFNNKDNNSKEDKANFDKAWQHHKDKNKHHWNYWAENNNNQTSGQICEMPKKYVLQMVCDWEAMAIKFGGSAKDYYLKNKDNIKLHDNSRRFLEWVLEI